MYVLQKELNSTKAYCLTSLNAKDVIDDHLTKLSEFKVNITEKCKKLPTMYWLPKLHKKTYKARFIANSSSTTTTHISKLLSSCLSAIKKEVVKYCNKVYENSGINLFWSIKNSSEVLNKFNNLRFRASNVSTFDFSTLYTSLPHSLIKDKLTQLIKKTFSRSDNTFLACNEEKAFFTSSKHKKFNAWTCQNVCEALNFLLNNIYTRFGELIFKQNVGIPMGTNCAPLIADLFLYCYERDFMLSLSIDTQMNMIEAFNNTSRYLDDILNIDNDFFTNMIHKIYPKELQLIKANVSDTHVSFLDLDIHILDGIIITKIYDKRDDYNFEIINFPSLDSDIPRRPSYGVYISQLIRYARCCSNLKDFNNRNLLLTKKLLTQGYRYHKLVKTFRKFCYKNPDLINKYDISVKAMLKAGLSKPQFYGDLLYKIRKILNSSYFDQLFIKLINNFKRKGYDVNLLKTTTDKILCKPTVDRFMFLF